MVLKDWIIGISEALYKPAMYNTEPLLDTVAKLVRTKPVVRKMSILATNINTGCYFIF